MVSGEVSSSSLKELSALSEIITAFGLSDKFILDFSVMNDVSYYNGLVFQGFVSGIPKAVLSGGRYDNLVRRFGCETSAAGFAVAVDLIKEYRYSEPEFDYDVMLVYAEDCNPAAVLKVQTEISNNGSSCIAVSKEPEWIKCRKKIILSADGSMKNE